MTAFLASLSIATIFVVVPTAVAQKSSANGGGMLDLEDVGSSQIESDAALSHATAPTNANIGNAGAAQIEALGVGTDPNLRLSPKMDGQLVPNVLIPRGPLTTSPLSSSFGASITGK